MSKIAVVIADIKNSNFGDRLIFSVVSRNLLNQGFDQVIKLSDRNSSEGEIKHVRFADVGKSIASIYRADVVVIGGGGIVQDDTGPLNLVYFALCSLVAMLLGKNVHVESVGVTPAKRILSRFLIKLLCASASSISVRDVSSKRELMKYTKKDILVKEDPVLNHPEKSHLQASDCKKNMMTLTLCPAPEYCDGYSFIDPLIETVNGILLSDDFCIKIMVFHPGKDMGISRYAKNKIAHKVELVSSFSLVDYYSLALDSKLNICMRLHSSVICESIGAKYFSIAYNKKTVDFHESVNKLDYCYAPDDLECFLGEVRQILSET